MSDMLLNDTLKNKKILVTGVNGQVGRAVVEQLTGKCQLITAARDGADVVFDLGNFQQIRDVIAEIKPDIVINPAAYTKVDQAEDEPELAMRINGQAVGVIAESCKSIDALLIHYSTDYVFKGDGKEPYKEDDATDPVNVYGESKLAGEQAIQAVNCRHLIFRTCWVYDAHGRNFVNAILDRARKMEDLKVVNDQIGTPTSAFFIAETTYKLLISERLADFDLTSGNRVFNLRPDGECSWHEFAEFLVNLEGSKEALRVKNILAVDSSEFPTRAVRPNWSVLDNQKLKLSVDLRLSHWRECAEQCLSR